MAKIVLDTNIIARAVVSSLGLAAEILRRSVDKPNLHCSSNYILCELDRVLRYPRLRKMRGLSDGEIENFVRSVQQVSLVVDVGAAEAVTRDAKDNPIVETAIQVNANYLCSNDKDMQTPQVIDHCNAFGVQVVNDTQLLAFLRNLSS